MAKKFTKEELSRILTAHSNKQLIHFGSECFGGDMSPRGIGCINQFAYNEPHNDKALKLNRKAGEWFDLHYSYGMSVESLVDSLVKIGVA